MGAVTHLNDSDAIRHKVEERVKVEASEYGIHPPQRAFPTLSEWHAANRFTGPAPQREFLVEGVFPMGQPALLAGMGGVGKSFQLLSLACDVAKGATRSLPRRPEHFGSTLTTFGTAVYISVEDDAIEIHNRLEALGRPPEQLITVPLPSAEGGGTLFEPATTNRRPVATDAWEDLTEQLINIPGLALIALDPLQALCTLDLNLPENSQAVCTHIRTLAAQTKAAVILSHHFRKQTVKNRTEARQAVRGSAGLVDGVRAVYAMWNAGDSMKKRDINKLCESTGVPPSSEKVIKGAVIKANGRADNTLSTFVRLDSGLLKPVRAGLDIVSDNAELKNILVKAIAEAAHQGKPFTKTGMNGPFERKHELPEELQDISKHRFPSLVNDLLKEGRVKTSLAKGVTVKWLDVPDGPFSKGVGKFLPGAAKGAD